MSIDNLFFRNISSTSGQQKFKASVGEMEGQHTQPKRIYPQTTKEIQGPKGV